MGAVRLLVRSELRRRWREPGRRRAAGRRSRAARPWRRWPARAGRPRSFDRFRASTRSHDVLLVFAEGIGPADVHKLRVAPGRGRGRATSRQLAMVRPDGDFLAVGGPLDGAMFHDINRMRIVAGRARPSPTCPRRWSFPSRSQARRTFASATSLPVRGLQPRADRPDHHVRTTATSRSRRGPRYGCTSSGSAVCPSTSACRAERVEC